MASPADLFPDAGEMDAWLNAMCQGCVKDYGRNRTELGGMNCPLVWGATDSENTNIPDWSPDASPVPQRVTDEYGPRAPVCMAYTPRKKRSDAGIRRGKHTYTGQQPLFTT